MNGKKALVALSIFFASTAVVHAADLDLDVDFKYVSGTNPKQDIVQKVAEFHGKTMAYDDLTHLNDLINDSKVMNDKDSDFQLMDGGASYEMTVSQNGVTKHFKWSPGHCPKDLKALIQYVENRSSKTVTKPSKKKD